MTKTVTLSDTEANLVRLAAQTRDNATAQLNANFNSVINPILRAHSVAAEHVDLSPGPDGTVTMTWTVPDIEVGKKKR